MPTGRRHASLPNHLEQPPCYVCTLSHLIHLRSCARRRLDVDSAFNRGSRQLTPIRGNVRMSVKKSNMWRGGGGRSVMTLPLGIGADPKPLPPQIPSFLQPILSLGWLRCFRPLPSSARFVFSFSLFSFSSQSLIPLDFYHRRRYISLSLPYSLPLPH